MADLELTLGGWDRLRISSWAEAGFFMNLIPNPAVPGTTMPNPDNPFRAGAAGSARGVLDDVSLLRTIRNDEGMNLVWDTGVLPGSSDEQRRDFFNQVIDDCHNHGVQCLAGFGQVSPQFAPGPKTKALSDWLANPGSFINGVQTPSIEDFAASVVAFLFTQMPEADGISFDIEGITAAQHQIQTVGDNLTEFYQTIAVFIGPSKLVAIAGGGLISDTDASRLFVTLPDGTKQEVPFTRLPAQTTALVHRYDVAAPGLKNILFRPMAYDNFLGMPDSVVFDWHEDILNYALRVKNLSPAQFQLGIKTIKGAQGGEVTNPDDVQRRCRDLLSPNRVGLAFFPTSESFWQGANDALNPLPVPRAPFPNQPLQGRLSIDAALQLLGSGL